MEHIAIKYGINLELDIVCNICNHDLIIKSCCEDNRIVIYVEPCECTKESNNE